MESRKPAPPQFQESVRFAEQNLYSKAKELLGDRDPRSAEFSLQLRAFDSSKSGNGMGIAVLMGMCSSILEKSTKGGLVIVGQLNLGGSLDMVYNAVNLAEIAVEKGATTLLIPLNARKQLNDLSDDMITKINIQYYTDLKDCLIKTLMD
jgi:ATP-dependent Lon protease